MSIHSMLSSLEQEAKNELQKIKEEADNQISQIREEASLKAKQIHSSVLLKAKDEMALEYSVQISKSKSQSNQIILNAQHQVFDRLLEKARNDIKSFSENSNYPKTLAHLIQESLDSLSDHFTLEVSPRDVKSTQNILKQFKWNAEITTNSNIAGGVIVKAQESRLIIQNTFESRLKKVFDNSKTELSKILWPNNSNQ